MDDLVVQQIRPHSQMRPAKLGMATDKVGAGAANQRASAEGLRLEWWQSVIEAVILAEKVCCWR
jgi:hypothetical protein